MKKKAIIGISSAAIIVTLGLLPEMENKTKQKVIQTQQITYQQAKNNTHQRQAYIDQVVRKNPWPKGLNYVKYVDENRAGFLKREDIMQTYKRFESYSSEGEVFIEIYKAAFDAEVIKTEQDFQSFLIDHEYHHVKQLTNKANIRIKKELLPHFEKLVSQVHDNPMLRIFLELGAYTNQMEGFRIRSVSKPMQIRIKESFTDYYRMLDKPEFKENPVAKYLKTYYNPSKNKR